MLAQEEFEIELLLAGNLLEGGVEPLAEDILARLARDELEAVAAQRENVDAASSAASSSVRTVEEFLSACSRGNSPSARA